MFLLGLGVRERGLGGVSGGGPGDACSLSPAWAQTSRRPQLALFQGRAEPWEQTQIRRIWCLFFVPLLLRWKVRKKGIKQRLSPCGAFKYVSEPPEKRAARDVASAAVEIDFKHICPLGPRQRRAPALALRGDDQ